MASTRTPCPSLTPDASQAPSGALLVDLQERRQAMDGEFYTFEDFIRYYPKGKAYLYWNRAVPPSGAPVDGAAEHGDSSHKWDSGDITYDDSSDRPWGHRTDGSDSVDGAPGLGLQEIQERSVGATEHTLVHIMLRQDLRELQLAHGKGKQKFHDEARALLNNMAEQETTTSFDLTEMAELESIHSHTQICPAASRLGHHRIHGRVHSRHAGSQPPRQCAWT